MIGDSVGGRNSSFHVRTDETLDSRGSSYILTATLRVGRDNSDKVWTALHIRRCGSLCGIGHWHMVGAGEVGSQASPTRPIPPHPPSLLPPSFTLYDRKMFWSSTPTTVAAEQYHCQVSGRGQMLKLSYLALTCQPFRPPQRPYMNR